jgi:glycosyltransferase involved in cell wall biosynthesis
MGKRCSLEMNKPPKVSVLMTVYNGGDHIYESINCVLNQTFSDWELILVDNCSTDNTHHILSGFADKRIKIIKFSKNMGRIYALRHAFEMSSGDFLAILDADDLARSDRFDQQVNHLSKTPTISLVASWTRLIDGKNNIIGLLRPPTEHNLIHQNLGWANIINHSSIMFRKKVALRFGGYSEDFEWGHDFSLILSMAEISGIGMIDEFLCDVRIIKSSMTRSKDYEMIVALENIKLFKKASSVLSLNSKGKKLNKIAIAVAEVRYGLALLKTKSTIKGLQIITSRIICNPSVLWRNGPAKRFFQQYFKLL